MYVVLHDCESARGDLFCHYKSNGIENGRSALTSAAPN
jgi:hypothetical protein